MNRNDIIRVAEARLKEKTMDKPIPKEWWDWFLSPPENWNEKYGDAFVWTPEEKMLMQKLKEKNK